MKKIVQTNDDYKGYAEHIRHACRGILLNGDNVLLCYESNTKPFFPFGKIFTQNTIFSVDFPERESYT